MKKYMNAFVCLVLTQTAIAQSNKLGIDLGYQRVSMIDKQVSLLKAKSWQPLASLSYLHTYPRGEFVVKVGASTGSFSPSSLKGNNWYGQDGGNPHNDSSILLDRLYGAKIKIGYSWDVLTGGRSTPKAVKHRLLVGGSVNDQAFYSRNSARFGWLNSVSLNADVSYLLQVKNRSLFRAEVSVPIVGLATRQPYGSSEHPDTEKSDIRNLLSGKTRLSYPGNFQNVQFSASYEYTLSQHLGVGVKYSGQWLRYSQARLIKSFEQNAAITFNVKF